MVYDELAKRLRDKASRFDYDGWVDTAAILEEAADAIEEQQNTYDAVTNVQKHVIENLKNDLDFAIRAKAAAIKACTPRWIPVTERLPEEDTICILTNGVSNAIGYRGKVFGFHLIWTDDIEGNEVAHWMPLPKPPEEES